MVAYAAKHTSYHMPSRQPKKTASPSNTGQRFTFDLMMVPYGIIVSALVLFGCILLLQQRQVKHTMPEDRYQAVFMANGQVYFGHLHTLSRSYLRLTDVYYLQQQDLTPSDDGGGAAEPQFSVIRLGEEIHQPEQQLILNKDQILYWQNLQQNSRIIEAILQYPE